MRTFVVLAFTVQLIFGIPIAKNDEYLEKYPELNGRYFQGDMILSPNQRNGLIDEYSRWPNGIVPITFESDITEEQQQKVMDAVSFFHEHTCVKFVKKTKLHEDYVVISSEKSGCSARVGRSGGEQFVNLASGCFNIGTIAHELMHAIGFYHEQSRTDRDDYITIVTENIKEDHIHNFNKYDLDTIGYFNQTYDYGSIMHYPKRAFSKNGNDTIIPKEANAVIGQRERLSDKDIAKIYQMYNCNQLLS